MKVASDKVRDLLDFNNYIVIAEDFKNVKRGKLEKAFSFSNNSILLNYIMGQHLVSEIVPYFDLRVVGKTGPLHFTNLCRNSPNFIRFKD